MRPEIFCRIVHLKLVDPEQEHAPELASVPALENVRGQAKVVSQRVVPIR